MEIRLLSAEDLNETFALRLEMLQNAPSAFLVTHAEQQAEGPVRFASLLEQADLRNVLFGAFLGGVLVGCVGVKRSEGRHKITHKADIWGMYVSPGGRRQGVGAALIAAAVAHARGPVGATTLYLSVEGENKEARRLYERAGFKLWGTEPRAMRVDGKYVDEHHLWLTLD